MDLARQANDDADTLSLLRKRLAGPLGQVENMMLSTIMSGDAAAKRLFSSMQRPGGKRIRPILVLLSAEGFGATGYESIVVATSAELVHMATLVHDDVVDHAQLRRGEPTLHSIWGNKLAVLGGDYLFAKAFDLLVKAEDLRLFEAMSGMIAGMGEGEILQLFHAFDVETTEADYFERIRRKTAWFMSTCAEMGAIIGHANEAQVKAAHDYGMAIGMAFQIVDDMLDLVGEQTTVGKTVGADLFEGNLTLPVLHTLQGANGDEVRAIIEQRDLKPESVARIVEIVKAEGSLEYAFNVAQQYVHAAQRELRALPSSEAVGCLFDLADYMIARDW